MLKLLKLLRILRRKFRYWANATQEPEPLLLMRHITEPELHELVEVGKPIDLSMELLVEYLEKRTEGHLPQEAKQLALREWDL